MRFSCFAFLLLSFTLMAGCSNTEKHTANTPSSAPVPAPVPSLSATTFNFSVPISREFNKINLQASVNGLDYRFIVDSGSPTILSKKVADKLGLVPHGSNTGTDANGNSLTMQLAMLDNLTIGPISVRNIQVFIMDETTVPGSDCVFDGGIIGAEILSLLTWQINLPANSMTFSHTAANLNYLEGASTSPFVFSGYPFYPLVQYKINQTFVNTALLDTGNTELLHLNNQSFQHLINNDIVEQSSSEASGSFGVSGAGGGQVEHFYAVEIAQLTIGDFTLQNVNSWVKNSEPSLLGIGIFAQHIVTSDHLTKTLHFYPDSSVNQQPHNYGFKLQLNENNVFVSFIEQGSIAEQAGLKLHDKVLSFNEHTMFPITPANTCAVLAKTVNINQLDAVRLRVQRGAQIHNITL